jgi:hypothetical protein
MDMRFGTWNVRSLYRADSLMKDVKEISKYKLDLVRRVQEVRCNRVALHQQVNIHSSMVRGEDLG